jgi:hypothetical protein
MANYGSQSAFFTKFSNLGSYNLAANMGIPQKGINPSMTQVPVYPSKGITTLTYNTTAEYPMFSSAYGDSCPQNYFFSNRCDLGYSSQLDTNVSSK